MLRIVAGAVLGSCFVLLAGETASAQVIGTFRWRLDPYCNTLTLTVIQDVGGFRIRGTEDLCDAVYIAQPVHGVAVIDRDGTAVLNLTTALPGGFTTKGFRLTAGVNPATLQGAWFDDVGRGGSLVPTSTPSTPGLQRGSAAMTFVHSVSAATRPSASSNISCFSHPLTDDRSGALMQVTQNRGQQTTIAPVVLSGVSVYFDNDGTGLAAPLDNNVWCLSRNDSAPMPNGARFTISVQSR